jgi:large subunit ribosomal protein L9
MKVVLRQDVANVGRAGDIKDVADGYARNFLIPRKLAAPATKTELQNVQAYQAAATKRNAALEADHRALAEKVEATPLVIHARTGEQGRLYGSVTSADIAEALTKSVGKPIDKRDIELDEPIRTTGDHKAHLHIATGITATVSVDVQANE